jgi:hypothetical protein
LEFNPHVRNHYLASLYLLAAAPVLSMVGAGGCSVNNTGLSDPGGGGGGNIPVLVPDGSVSGTGGSRTGAGGAIGAGGGGGGPTLGTGGAAGAGGSGAGGRGVGGAGNISTGGTGAGGMGTGGIVASGSGGSGTGGAGTGGEITSSGGAGGAATGTGGGAGGMTGTGGAPPSPIGCADGTREAFTDANRFPSIAGCAGGWSIPGVLSVPSMTPACGRAAGNLSGNVNGDGCTVEDLCADGWHVCAGAAELTTLGVTCQQAAVPAIGPGTGSLFFVTRQRGRTLTACMPNDNTGTNNLHGCGNFGTAEDVRCAPPLDRQLTGANCTANPPWSCASSLGTDEALLVTKPGAAGGGVLCCR